MNCKYCKCLTVNNTEFCSHRCSTTYFSKYVWESKKRGSCKNCSIGIISSRKYCDDCWKTVKVRKHPPTHMTDDINCKICLSIKTEETTLKIDGRWKENCRKCDAKQKATRVKNFKEKWWLLVSNNCNNCPQLAGVKPCWNCTQWDKWVTYYKKGFVK